MPLPHIPFKSYCWCLGTTSYRTKNFNQNIERQLALLSDFWASQANETAKWSGNDKLQTAYYDYMKAAEFVGGDAGNKPKDARQKTSGLKDIGLISEERRLTAAGNDLLKISKSAVFISDHPLQIQKDSFIYLKQLMKTSYDADGEIVRPFMIFLYLQTQLKYLSFDEFTYLLPLCTNSETTRKIIADVIMVRKGEKKTDEVITETLMGMDNYAAASALFLKTDVTEDLICTIGFNRKSRSYDKPYYPLYQALYRACVLNEAEAVADVYKAINLIRIGKHWLDFLFDTTSKRAIASAPMEHFKQTPLTQAKNEKEFKTAFFKAMHLFKAKATLSDYLDLNRRYMQTTDIVLFEDDTVKLDIIPKHFFEDKQDALLDIAFEASDLIYENCSLQDIHPAFIFDEASVITGINAELGTAVTTLNEAYMAVDDERYNRLQKLIDAKFTDKALIDLLSWFETRKDSEISTATTDNADIPTIFEYVLGIIWYKASGRQGKILDYMKLSLDADLLPKSHAAGGEADIVYEYEETADYPKHCLLLEATLANSNNQRSMEMEPVSRHLGQHLLRTGNESAYCIFVSNHLNINVISDFRSRKTTEWFDTQDYSKSVSGMKIIPLQTSELKAIIRNKTPYSTLYGIFEQAYHSAARVPDWYGQNIKSAID